MLKIDNLYTCYGNIEALKGVSLEIGQGEIVAIIGANGAGKSTMLNTISGVLHPKQGKIEFIGKRIDNLPAHAVVERGISQAPEGRRIFPQLTVIENLEMGAYSRNFKFQISNFKSELEKVFAYFPILKERLKQLGGTLSGGEQQMLAIARALMAHPKMLLLDEPSLGLAPMMVRKIFEIIKRINQEGMTILLVEQNAHAALKLANRGYVMETGRVVMYDDASALLKNPQLRAAYLGEG
ncbi:MAG: ABC transporter ATP-binding protein [Deltaproteobacteria bacterium RIFCSPLOWO2_12_FULL_43_16]|nr:MAG: ABC transporter ATP-binding protein [Deltaproteobacteria bacterium GWA2_43_19]OGQ12223.1 MAG: ABC transporter ATP-binding protein [Deltaproteobacteria bacterium RIFCSPHIGHO2_02_FULL_43_33]OGQ59894.1 MAG: ABC transporter ATP-binding protein [Deltaproteobacteria bacterium RIFCSPLOWO2_12_FULL_43_16]HBR17611.1 ABC transporter ATP-binding protein [Deltaproteobacteria bacterium]